MKKTRARLKHVWDNTLEDAVAHSFEKFSGEVSEHGQMLKWVASRILLPFSIFYIIIGFWLKQNIFDSLFLGLIIFIYSNFLPDLDSLIRVTKHKNKLSAWYDKYILLFFAPVFIYYAVSGRAKPIYSLRQKEFHTLKAFAAYMGFIIIVSAIFWGNNLERIAFLLFTALGYTTHLVVDGYIKW